MKTTKSQKLTLKMARGAAVMALGTAKGLERTRECECMHRDRYEIQMGEVHVFIRRDYDSENIKVSLASDGARTINMLFDPATLKRDWHEEDIQRREAEREEFDEWVGCYGPEVCKAQIDKSWNGRLSS